MSSLPNALPTRNSRSPWMYQVECINPDSPEGIFLKSVDCIIWDEVCVTDKRVLDAVSLLFKDLKNTEYDFGGVLTIMGGDWHQILPVVKGIKGHGVETFILKNSEPWPRIEKFELTENKRAESDPAYARRILQIGSIYQKSSTNAEETKHLLTGYFRTTTTSISPKMLTTIFWRN
ncbi:unnamed protein product [Caenorhabditis nigoni]